MFNVSTRLVLLLGGLHCATGAVAADLMEIYRAALQSDPVYQARISANLASQENRPQAMAGLLPNASLGANTGFNEQDSSRSNTSSRYNSHGYSLSITQPVFRWDRWIQLEQADYTIKQANAELDNERQSLIVRVAQAYFQVLGAQDNLEFAKKTKEAIARQLEQARQRFDVGLIAITDVEEAKAQYDLAVADEITAVNDVENAWEAMQEITGLGPTELSRLQDDMSLLSPDPEDIDAWTNIALEQSYSLKAAIYASHAAREEINRRRAGHLPTLDLVGGRDYSSSGGGSFGASRTRTDSIALQLNMPIFSGGATVSSTRQAAHQYQQSLDTVEQVRRSVQRQTRESYLGALASIARVTALKQSLKSTETALEATEAGFLAGTRTTVDVLDAQRNTFRAIRDYQRARYDYILNYVSLKQAAGTLAEEDVQAINTRLQ